MAQGQVGRDRFRSVAVVPEAGQNRARDENLRAQHITRVGEAVVPGEQGNKVCQSSVVQHMGVCQAAFVGSPSPFKSSFPDVLALGGVVVLYIFRLSVENAADRKRQFGSQECVIRD